MKALMDNTTTVVALGGVTSPVWNEPLQDISTIAGLILPILGAVWLVIQIVVYLRSGRKPNE